MKTKHSGLIMGPAAAPQAPTATKFWNMASTGDDEGEITLYGDVMSQQPVDCCQILHEAFRRDKKAGLRFACPPVNGLLAHNVAIESDLPLVVACAGHIPELCRRGSLWSSSRAHD